MNAGFSRQPVFIGETQLITFFADDFMGIFNKINEQVQDKFQKGEIDDSLLSSEAEQMLPTMMNNPFFQNMMKSDMFQNLDANVDKAEEK